jgi:iduronate 2-sulfatase
MFDDPSYRVRDSAFCVAPSGRGFLLREDRWAFIQYAEDASKGIELFDTVNDPGQYSNLAGKPEFAPVVEGFRAKLAARRAEVQDNDLKPN